MHRPEKVGDAIRQDRSGIHSGHYGPFVLHSAYQPLYSLDNQDVQIIGVEGLIRPMQGVTTISPCDFFAMTTKDDLLFVEMMCRALHIRNFASVEAAGIDLFVNLNPEIYDNMGTMLHELDAMIERMAAIQFPTDKLVFEIVEKACPTLEVLKEIIRHFRALGIRVAIDDFGTACSNFERVADVEPDYVKLDRQWTKNMKREAGNVRMLDAIVRHLQASDIGVIFEGVETMEELAFANDRGAMAVQGFLLCRPKLLPLPNSALHANIDLPKNDREVLRRRQMEASR